MISKSPDRNSFLRNRILETKNKDYIDSILNKNELEKFSDPEKRKNNLEWDLRTTDWILEKARSSEVYAQHIYAALCNNGFIKLDPIQILKEIEWNCSWRYAGGIVADMRETGDYIDWYCSGKRIGIDLDLEEKELTEEQKQRIEIINNYVPEGKITKEIREDLRRLGWTPNAGGDWENFDE